MLSTGVSQRALEEVAGLNHAFFTLLKACDGEEMAAWLGLQPATIRHLYSLDGQSVQRLSRLPFALFSLRLHDLPVWESVVECGVSEASGPGGWPDDASGRQQFLVMALGALRDMARTEPLSTSLLFGIPRDLARAIAKTEIAWLPVIADAIKPWLRARHADRWEWWEAIVSNAALSRTGVAQLHFGVHLSLQRALSLQNARLPRGRLCRSR